MLKDIGLILVGLVIVGLYAFGAQWLVDKILGKEDLTKDLIKEIKRAKKEQEKKDVKLPPLLFQWWWFD